MPKAPAHPITVWSDKKAKTRERATKTHMPPHQLKRVLLPGSLDVLFSLRYRR